VRADGTTSYDAAPAIALNKGVPKVRETPVRNVPPIAESQRASDKTRSASLVSPLASASATKFVHAVATNMKRYADASISVHAGDNEAN
jgi:hypothetical protein